MLEDTGQEGQTRQVLRCGIGVARGGGGPSEIKLLLGVFSKSVGNPGQSLDVFLIGCTSQMPVPQNMILG